MHKFWFGKKAGFSSLLILDIAAIKKGNGAPGGEIWAPSTAGGKSLTNLTGNILGIAFFSDDTIFFT